MPQESIRSAIARRMTHLGDELHILRAVEGLVRELEDHHPGTQVTLTDSAVSIIVPLPRVAGGVETSDNGGVASHLVPDTWVPIRDATSEQAGHVRTEGPAKDTTPAPYTEAEDAEIRRLWQKGRTLPEIAHAIGRAEKSLSNRFYRHIKPTLGADGPRNAAWTDEEDMQVVTRRAAGATQREIAAKLGRSTQAVKARIRSHLSTRIEEAQAFPTISDKPAEAAPEPAAPHPAAPQATEPQPGYTGPDEPLDNPRAMRRHLERLGSTAFWTPANDLFLVEQIGRGRKLKDVAEDMGATKADAAARFRQLCPQPGIDTQQLLLEELRRRASASEAAE